MEALLAPAVTRPAETLGALRFGRRRRLVRDLLQRAEWARQARETPRVDALAEWD
ncbi:MAG TPA: hypothetical protein VMU51_02550 [Mycobacteriales bacterium]|nr:hypothetical protein [Mycobacteriales bacterium]